MNEWMSRSEQSNKMSMQQQMFQVYTPKHESIFYTEIKDAEWIATKYTLPLTFITTIHFYEENFEKSSHQTSWVTPCVL